MSEFKGIPGHDSRAGRQRGRAAQKYVTPQGFTAIRDGIKAASAPGAAALAPVARKPSWLRAPMPAGRGFDAVKQTVREHRLATVCEEAKCPNIGECWNAGTATIMLMGEVCTRACRFCAVDTGNPRGWLDAEEPANAARTVQLMKLKYVVLTSVNRDDLPDGGAAHFAACVREIKRLNPQHGGRGADARFPGRAARRRDRRRQRARRVRAERRDGASPDAPGARSARVVRADARGARAREAAPARAGRRARQDEPDARASARPTPKSSRRCADLRAVGVDMLTLGQYLRPTVNHLPVERFVRPEEFERVPRRRRSTLGFLECVAGPLVRSSYRAEQALARNNAGLGEGGLAQRG